MNFDALLSQFKIQTKVIALVVPFVASITAVGLVGLYASGLLQGRLEVSNVVVESLSGFRETSAAMAKFMVETNGENFENVKSMVTAQAEALKRIQSGLPPASESHADIGTAVVSSQSVETGMETLWDLHQRETELRNTIDNSLAQMLAARKMLEDQHSTVARNIANDETAAKVSLFAAGNLAEARSRIEDIYNGYKGVSRPTARIIVLRSSLAEIPARMEILSANLPDAKKVIAETAKRAFEQIGSVVASGDKSDVAFAVIDAEMEKIRVAADQIRDIYEPVLFKSVQLLASLDKPAARAENIQKGSNNVEGDVYAIQIALAKFLIIPSAENQQRVGEQLEAIDGHLKSLAETATGETFLTDLLDVLKPAIGRMASGTLELVDLEKERVAAFFGTSQNVDRVWQTLTKFATEQKVSGDDERQRANTISVGATLLGIVIAVLAGLAMIVTFKGPISRITLAMRKLADGGLDTSIEGTARADEIGDMARALGVFKQNAVEKIKIEQASADQREAADAERAFNEAEKRSREEQAAFAVAQLASALGKLSIGDLTCLIETPFGGSFEQLRADFNRSVSRLSDTLEQIRENASNLRERGTFMRSASADLSKRTESQAASLEETAAAVEEITVTVKSTADRARQANGIATETRQNAVASGDIVRNAVDAMSRIESASNQIQQIIDMIEDISFQTNLLALNAGVEAARAGEAGKGFAVVAMEVRELAQRSAAAANEIKGLINTASTEVSSGSALVKETGRALSKICEQITELSMHVQGIATAAGDQSGALHEVNNTVNRMDQMTQANAAMVEETDELSQQLAIEADILTQLVGGFKLSSSRDAVTGGKLGNRR
jgi:methyl-accepting chemotaxis protein